MKARHLFAFVALALTAGMAACDDDDGTGPDEDNEFAATLTAANEVPPVTSSATGTATFELNDAETSADWTITVTGLTSSITNAHIHLGKPGHQSGRVIVLLPGWPTTGTSGTWSGTLTSGASLSEGLTWTSLIDLIRNGDTYVNVHTANFGGGEVRGPLLPTD
jgi:hypothetical protein